MSLTMLAVAQPPRRPRRRSARRWVTRRSRRATWRGEALIYVRQSSPTQVQRHPESARRQYALAERAHRLGWPAEQVTIIDEDQGKSGAGSAADPRAGRLCPAGVGGRAGGGGDRAGPGGLPLRPQLGRVVSAAGAGRAGRRPDRRRGGDL